MGWVEWLVGTCWGEERNGEKWWLHVVSKIFKEFLREKHGKNMKELDLRMGTWDLSKKTCVTLEGNRGNTQTQTGDFNNTTRESDMICRIRTKAIEMKSSKKCVRDPRAFPGYDRWCFLHSKFRAFLWRVAVLDLDGYCTWSSRFSPDFTQLQLR